VSAGLDDGDLRRRAERRVAAKAGFRIHALVYVLVNAGLLGVNLLTSPQYLWACWPMVGWGIGLAAHGLSVYGSRPGWREAEIVREMDRLRRG
jgi:hypothetical protein